MTPLTNDQFVFNPGGVRGQIQRTLYRFGRWSTGMLFIFLWRRKVIGGDNVPLKGPVILAPNHASYADPPLVGSSAPRPLYFMAKEELFKVPIFGWIIRQVNAFPIRRKEGDVGALRTAQRILAAGGALIVFPEGGRQKGGRWGKPRRGVGVLAALSQAPVVPVYLHNTHRLTEFAPFTVVFGKPILKSAEESTEAFSERVMGAVRALQEAHFGNPAA